MSTPLLKGQKAPDFEAKTLDGKTVRLGQFEGSLVWLIFYRYARCPLCNLHLNAVMRRKVSFDECGLNVLCVFESRADQFPKQPGNQVAQPFPLIPDPTKELYRLYGLESRNSAAFTPRVAKEFFRAILTGYPQGKIEGTFGQIPAHFLIAEDGIIETVYYGSDIADHLPWEKLERFVKERRQTKWHRNQA